MKALEGYPKSLPGGLIVRPLQAGDEAALLTFFQRIPADERQLLRDDVTDPGVIHNWVHKLDFSRVLPLVALAGPRIVGDATLHRDRRGWSHHVAKLRVTLDPEFRRRGLGRALVLELVELARALGTSILDAEILSRQNVALKLFEKLGFACAATLPQHAFDFAGRVHDICVYSLTVIPPEKLIPDARAREGETDVGGG